MAFKRIRTIETEERNHKIENMEMDELKRYLCMKNNQKPEKCAECVGLKSCTAGQRAMVLLNQMELERLKQKQDIGTNRKGTKEQKQAIARKKFMQALNQRDMIQHLMETYGNTRNCARENLKHWAKIFPDLAEQYEFEKRFFELTLCHNTALKGSAAEKQKNAKEAYAEAIQQSDPVAYVMEKFSTDRAHAVKRLSNWKSRYGEKEEKTVENEEISVEDFLKEVENTTESSEKSVESAPKPETENHPAGNKSDFFGDLNAKYKELAAEKERLKDRIAWIEKAQDALAMTLNIFNPESAIAKGVFGE